MNENNYLVIMAGGVGTRFWPMSKTETPKQFIDILGTGKTLIRQTYERFVNICPTENIYVVTNELYKEQVKEQIPEIDYSQILCEPTRRNTAPCIAYASHKILKRNPDANMVVTPADHIILKEDAFEKIIKSALATTKDQDILMTLGIEPSRPDTGYGYIQFQEADFEVIDDRVKKVKTFMEKPNLELAKQFLESGDFVWNSGIFIWSAKSINKAFDLYLPDVNELFKQGAAFYDSPEEKEFITKTYAVSKSISIDYGIMEKASNVYTLKSEFGWSDLGTWGSLFDIREKDTSNNAIIGEHVMTYNTTNCIVNMPKDKLVVLEGMDDCIVVEANNILLVCKKPHEQQIRQFVNDVMIEKGEEYV